jgi:hypothetical protein
MELTLEQHLSNIKVAIVNHKGTYDELVSIRTSYNHIEKLLTAKPEEKGKLDPKLILP